MSENLTCLRRTKRFTPAHLVPTALAKRSLTPCKGNPTPQVFLRLFCMVPATA